MTLCRARSLYFAVPAVVLALAFSHAGCSGQGEGERCDKQSDNDGNDDCDSNLVCTQAGKLANRDDIARCCPADLTQATSAACRPVGSGGTDAGAPTDASATDAATSDAATGTDAQSDAPSDAQTGATDASDGATDAPADAADASDGG